MSKKELLIFPFIVILVEFLATSTFSTFIKNTTVADKAFNSSPYTEKESLFAKNIPYDITDNPQEDNSSYGDVPNNDQLNILIDYNPDAIYIPDRSGSNL